jgi:hypothetical protein
MKPLKMAGLNALLAIAILGAACGPTETPTPTVDANMLYTAAAQTVVAELTQNAPPPTPIPTNTQAPTMTMAALPTIPPLGTLAPLKANTQPAASAGGDKCEYYTQSPADNSSVKTGQVFNVIWKIKNVGTTTWGPGYQWRFYSASNKLSTSASGYDMSATTAPNGIADITVVATAPGSAGTVDTTWVLTNPQGVNFCSFDIKVNVTASAAVVETAKPAAEAKMITYYEEDLNSLFGTADWTSGTFTHTNGSAYQARVLFRTDPTYTGSLIATGNNLVPNPVSMVSTSTGTGTATFGITQGIPYTLKIERPNKDQRVFQVDVCTTNVACW